MSYSWFEITAIYWVDIFKGHFIAIADGINCIEVDE